MDEIISKKEYYSDIYHQIYIRLLTESNKAIWTFRDGRLMSEKSSEETEREYQKVLSNK